MSQAKLKDLLAPHWHVTALTKFSQCVSTLFYHCERIHANQCQLQCQYIIISSGMYLWLFRDRTI